MQVYIASANLQNIFLALTIPKIIFIIALVMRINCPLFLLWSPGKKPAYQVFEYGE
jgi:hypothetical protein